MYGLFYPGVAIDGVEIDPTLTEAGRRCLGLGDNPRLHVYTADGRPFLERTHKRYDLIVVDAYRQPYVPFYLATREFFELARRHLRPGGILALNVAKVPGDDRLTRAVDTTLLAAFPQVWRWPALRFNDMVMALDRPVQRSILLRRASNVRGRLRLLVPTFRLEPRERLDVAAASARISLDELRARREAVQRGDGRRPERILSAARFAVGRNEVPDVGARVADRAHLPVEHRSHSLRPLVRDDHVSEPVIPVDDGCGQLFRHVRGQPLPDVDDIGQVSCLVHLPELGEPGDLAL